ncbi:sensor histidine kinase [Pseudolysobacter antarcticus]|uniref:Sensor histidine kinase n=1 Tax=Pseudolysobacter antarcticus TaxID=2511995 RepID=A0A411HIZ5_9GAMM|nr:sensor histidine kinase [Pseudolysobacter antarcticus]QBB70367.1 sensor histidine kinase [Pseudolysobacter antarcticus]
MLNTTLFTESSTPRNWRRWLFNPLRLAAYLVWIAVVLNTLLDNPPRLWNLQQLFGAIFTVSILLSLIATGVVRANTTQRSWLEPLLILAQSAFTLASIYCFPSSMQPVLLVILAVQVILSFRPAVALAFLLFVNLIFAWIGSYYWSRGGMIVSLLAYGSFQAFAALTAYYARRAEQANTELLAANAQLLSTRSLLEESARSQERLKLSRELHDVAGHKLTALKLNLQLLLRNAVFTNVEELQSCKQLADELLDDIRAVVSELRKYDGVDLRSALATLIAHLPGPKIHLNIANDSLLADVQSAETLLRCAQEALTNALRHSHASEIWLDLQRDGERVSLQVRDNGHGTAQLNFGNGLTGMRERLQALGGELRVLSGANTGLTLTANIPLQA